MSQIIHQIIASTVVVGAAASMLHSSQAFLNNMTRRQQLRLSLLKELSCGRYFAGIKNLSATSQFLGENGYQQEQITLGVVTAQGLWQSSYQALADHCPKIHSRLKFYQETSEDPLQPNWRFTLRPLS